MDINHLHLLLRTECLIAPGLQDEVKIYNKVCKLVKDIDMSVFMDPKVKYMPDLGNEGLSWVAGLETSHMSYHSWEKPDQKLMTYKNATLHQMDCYTCGCLNKKQVKNIFNFLTEYKPLQLNAVLFNRAKTLVEPEITIAYNYEVDGDFTNWLEKLSIVYRYQ